MNSGTQAAEEAGNMVDLDNNPTKLVEVVAIGKQLLMTSGSRTTFSVANDVALAMAYPLVPRVARARNLPRVRPSASKWSLARYKPTTGRKPRPWFRTCRLSCPGRWFTAAKFS